MATTYGNHGFNSKVSLGGNVVQYGVGDFNPAPVPVVPPQQQTLAFAFASDSADTYEYPRLGVAGSIDLNAVTLSNVSGLVWNLNNIGVAGTISVTYGDNLRVRINRTTAGQSASVSVVVEPSTATQTLSVPTTQWATWQDLSGLSPYPTEYENTKNALIALSGSDGVFQHSARSVETVTGPGWVEYKSNTYNTFFGLNYQGLTPTFPASHFSRMREALFITGNATTIYRNGVPQSNLVSGAGNFARKYRIRDTGFSIVYEYSIDEGATWTGSITSPQSYLSQSWQGDVCAQYLNAPIRGLQISL